MSNSYQSWMMIRLDEHQSCLWAQEACLSLLFRSFCRAEVWSHWKPSLVIVSRLTQFSIHKRPRLLMKLVFNDWHCCYVSQNRAYVHVSLCKWGGNIIMQPFLSRYYTNVGHVIWDVVFVHWPIRIPSCGLSQMLRRVQLRITFAVPYCYMNTADPHMLHFLLSLIC